MVMMVMVVTPLTVDSVVMYMALKNNFFSQVLVIKLRRLRLELD